MTSSTGRLDGHQIIVTGAGGFLGTILVKALLQEGARVIALDKAGKLTKLSEKTSPEGLVPLKGSFQESQGALASLIRKGERTAFFHLAGLSHVGRCAEDPMAAFRINVELSMAALLWCEKEGIAAFVFPSTGLIYGEDKGQPCRESDLPSPVSFYAATKLAAENLILGCQKTSGALILRLSNVYGPAMNPDTVVGRLVSQIHREPGLFVHNLAPVRDFIFQDDAIEGMIRLYLALGRKEALCVNLATGTGTSVDELAVKLYYAAGIPPGKRQIMQTGPTQESHLVLDNQLLQARTGWTPPTSLAQGLEATWNTKGAYEHA